MREVQSKLSSMGIKMLTVRLPSAYIFLKGSQFQELGGYGVVSETFLEAEVGVD